MAISITKTAVKGKDFLPAMKLATKSRRHEGFNNKKYLCAFVPLWQSIYTWFFIFLFFFSFILAGEGVVTPAVKFKHFSIKDGLSQSQVNCISQDKKGFIWFGTRDGLNKYDGFTFTVYKRIPGDKESLSDNYITAICQDNRGATWIATASGGLNRFDTGKNKFTRFTHDEKDPGSISSNNLNSVSVDSDGVLWIGTKDAGLNKFSISTGKSNRYIHIPGDPGTISCNNVQVTYRDKSGALWIGTGSGGLNRLNKNGGFLVYKNDPQNPQSLGDNDVQAIYEDSSGSLWIGTKNGGLNIFDREKENFSRYLKNDGDPFSISSNNITAICEDAAGNIWIATDNGINKFLPQTGKFTCYRHGYYDPHNITANRVLSICKDFSGGLWFGTVKGIEKYDKGKFSNLIEHINSGGFKVDNFVWSVIEDRPGILWIGTDSGGLYKYNRENNTLLNFKHEPGNPGSLSDNSVRALLADKSGTLWIGTKNGLNKYNSQEGTFTRYKIDPRVKNYPVNNHFSVIYEDSKGNFWLGSMGGGLLKFDRENQRFTVYASRFGDNTSLSNSYIRWILEDRGGTLWIGTHEGLNMLAGDKNSFSHYKHDPGNPHSLSHNHVHSIYEDKNGVLWIGTAWGLNRFDLKERTFTRYFEKDGLAGNVICGILENPAHRLWISTNRGLSTLNTVNETFKNYDVNDGLQSNEFNIGACFKSGNGELFFGGINGLNGFYPANIKNNGYIPPVVITGFKVLTSANVNRDADISGKIILSHNQNSFSVEYAALDYTNPAKNQYAYKMEGFDKNWIKAGTRRSVTYTGLKPGEYIFRVKGSNNDNIWNETGTSVEIIIRPSRWRTPMAYAFYGIVLVLAFVVFYRWQRQYIIKREKERSVIKETQRRAETAELQASVAKARTLQINEESKRKSLELEEARKFQLSMLPRRVPVLPHLEIAVSMKTASEVGGDYYDFMVAKDGALFAVCGDATGHGFKAGTMVSVIKTLFVANVLDPAEDFSRFFNECTGIIKKVGVSNLHMALTMLKIDNYDCTVSSAGMPPVFIFRKENNIVETIILKGPPLGAIKKFTYHYDYIHMEPGDTILLLTDGLPELFNRNKDMFGYDRVRECFNEVGEESAGEIVSYLNKRAERWLNYKAQDDDMTFVVIKFK